MTRSGIITLVVITLLFAAAATQAQPEKEYKTLYKRGVEQNKQGNLKEAINLYTQAIVKKSDSPELFFVRGRALKELERYDEALRDLTHAITLKPTYADAFNQRGIIHGGLGHTKEASQDFGKACELGNNDSCKNLLILKKIKKP